MVRTACHRFVLPTPLSRWPAHSWSQVQFPPARDAACSMPVNNAAERALRGVALGRKAWLFAGSDRGGDRAAVMYTLIGTAKLNDIDPAGLARRRPRAHRRPSHPAPPELVPWNWNAVAKAAAAS